MKRTQPFRVTSKTNPDHLISTYNLGEGRLVGSHGQDEWIHLALIHNDLLKIMIVSLDSDGEVSKIGETEVQTKLNEFNCRMECLILDENFFAGQLRRTKMFLTFIMQMMSDDRVLPIFHINIPRRTLLKSMSSPMKQSLIR